MTWVKSVVFSHDCRRARVLFSRTFQCFEGEEMRREGVRQKIFRPIVLVLVVVFSLFSEGAFGKPHLPSVYKPGTPIPNPPNHNPVCHDGAIMAAGRWEHYKQWLGGRTATNTTAIEYIVKHTGRVGAQNINTTNSRAGLDDSEVRGDRVVLIGHDLTNVESNPGAARHSLTATGRKNEVIELQNWNTAPRPNTKKPDKSNVATTENIVFQRRPEPPQEPFKTDHVQVREWNDGLPPRPILTQSQIDDLREFQKNEFRVKPIGSVPPDPPPLGPGGRPSPQPQPASMPPGAGALPAPGTPVGPQAQPASVPPGPQPLPAPDAYSGSEPAPATATPDKTPGELSDPRLGEYLMRYPNLYPYELEGIKRRLRDDPEVTVDELDPAVSAESLYQYPSGTLLPDAGEQPGGGHASGEEFPGSHAGTIDSHADEIDDHADEIDDHADEIDDHADEIKSWW